jgi:hypothetical protein
MNNLRTIKIITSAGEKTSPDFRSNKEAIKWLLQNCSEEELAASLLERSKELFHLTNGMKALL